MNPLAARSVLVPGGPFTMGTSTEPWALDNERPAHVRDLPAFRIATVPVTNAEYAAFVDAGGYDDPRWWTEATSLMCRPTAFDPVNTIAATSNSLSLMWRIASSSSRASLSGQNSVPSAVSASADAGGGTAGPRSVMVAIRSGRFNSTAIEP